MEAHAFGSLPAYVESLIDQPEAAQPLVALPSQVEKAVWGSMRGHRTDLIKGVTREAVGDTVFLLRLVLDLNVHVEQVLGVERLRHASLYWWSRALDPDRRTRKTLPPEWSGGVATLLGALDGTDAARRAAEARYLDGHDCLFPHLAVDWTDLLGAAEMLAGTGEDTVESALGDVAAARVRQVVYMARAYGLDAAGRWVAADAIARRVVRAQDDTAEVSR